MGACNHVYSKSPKGLYLTLALFQRKVTLQKFQANISAKKQDMLFQGCREAELGGGVRFIEIFKTLSLVDDGAEGVGEDMTDDIEESKPLPDEKEKG